MDSRDTHKQLFRALKEERLPAAFYFTGDETFLLDSTVREVIRRATDAATRDFNLEICRGPEVEAATLAGILGTPPLMARRRLVVIRDVEGLKKAARRELDRYLAHPAPDQLLILIAGAGAASDRALASRAEVVRFEPLSGDRLPRWIAHHAREELAAEIAPDAIGLLVAAVGEDLRSLAAELEKLAAYATHRAPATAPLIDVDAVQAIVGVRRGETLADLLDRLLDRDAGSALALVDHVLAQPKNGGVPVVMAIAAQTIALGYARARLGEGLAAGRVPDALFTLFKERSVMLGRPWGDAVRSITRAATSGRWSDDAIDAALDALLAADTALKQSGVSSEEQVLRTLVLAICGTRSGRRAA